MFFRHLDAAMAKQHRYLIDGNTGQKHFHGESVAEHMGTARLAGTVGVTEIGQAEEFTETAMIALQRTGELSLAAPKKIGRTDRG